MIKYERFQNKAFFYCLIGFLAVFSGCVNVGLKKAFPDIKTYALDLSAQDHTGPSGEPVSIRLNVFSAMPAFADRYLTYRTGETSYEQDFYNQLMTSPAGMVHDQALIWLKGSRRVSSILPADLAVSPDRVIDGKLLELYGDYRREESPKAVLKIQFTISNVDMGTPRILFQKVYSAEIPMTRPSPKELTEGWNTGLGRIMAEFENALE
jgi:cholesterol transport system auxiliary component